VHQTLRAVLPVAGRLYAVGTTDGVSASADGGQTWTQLGGSVTGRAPGQVIAFRGRLLAATADGVYQYPLTSDAPASASWWAALVGAALVVGSLAVAVLGLDRLRAVRARRPRAAEPRHQYERPFLGIEMFMAGMAAPPPSRPPLPERAERPRWSPDPSAPPPTRVLRPSNSEASRV
jgi:hypothetical protein